MTRSRIWTLGTAVVVVLVLAAGWFLLIAPTRADAADIKAQTATQEAANAQLVSSIEQLKVMAQDLPAQEAKLAKINQKIPTQPNLPSFIKELSAIAGDSKVVLVSMEPSAPAVLNAAAAPAPATTTDGSAPASTTTLGATGTSVSYIQASVSISGGYFNTEQFLTKLEGLKRAFLVTGFEIVASDDPDAKAGDVETKLQVRVFYTSDSAAPATATTTAPAN